MTAKLARDERYGFLHLDPVPSTNALAELYANEYYDFLERGDRFPEARRIRSGGDERDTELAWLRATLFSDVHALIRTYAPAGRVLDVGCGFGDLVGFLNEQGVDAVGLEPSRVAVEIAALAGRPVQIGSLDDIGATALRNRSEKIAAVLLMNVLEHVTDPASLVRTTVSLLDSRGIVCVRVPNDFSALQEAAQRKLQTEPWWICSPDHINYFDFESLTALLEGAGLTIVDSYGDFPMELFLLMGDNYLGDPERGAECHRRRVQFELSIPADARRRLYRAFAQARVGRTCIVTGRLGPY